MKVRVTLELTKRDIRLIQMIANDVRVKEQASFLGICRTRRDQIVTALYDKIGVTGKMQLVRWAIRKKIIQA